MPARFLCCTRLWKKNPLCILKMERYYETQSLADLKKKQSRVIPLLRLKKFHGFPIMEIHTIWFYKWATHRTQKLILFVYGLC